jgi:N-carbamoyl-L-amino-acid hydrolase
MAQHGNLRINGRRLWQSLMDMAEIGATPAGGNNRQAVTDLDGQARALFARWCAEAGLDMQVDRMGSMFASRAGADNTLAPVVIGSHLDTQPTGGRFDGVLGVLAALEAMRSLNDAGLTTKRPIAIVNWTNEEGTRFAPSLMASAVFAGTFTLDHAYGQSDGDGKSFGDELKRIGYAGDLEPGAFPIHAFLELHIEQGPILEDEICDVGVVTHAQGLRWYDVSLTGFESHTGSTPMEGRRNALMGAAHVVARVDDIAQTRKPHAVATVGTLEVHPNSRNIIPGKADLTVDLRHPDNDVLDGMEAELKAACREAGEKFGLEVAFDTAVAFAPTAFDPACVQAVRRAAEKMGLKHRDIISGASHDACQINLVAPAAMVFCPCIDGISHNEAEDITPEWAEAGANTLFHAALELAEKG